MRKLTVLFILLSGVLSAQKTEKLSLTVYVESYDERPVVSCILLQNNVYVKSNTINENDFCLIDSLEPGQYTLQIKVNDTLYAQYYYVSIISGHSNYYTYTIEPNENPVLVTSDGLDTKAEVIFDALYGKNTFMELHPLKNESYKGGCSVNYYLLASKYYSPGFHFGFSGAYTTFSVDSAKKFDQPIKHTYYSNGNISIGYLSRLTFYNNKSAHSNGFKIDAGIIYNLPVTFRRYQITDDHTRIKTYWIHRYNDFYALLRVAYKYIGLQAECNLTTFLKTGYTEIPKYRAGLVFTVPAY